MSKYQKHKRGCGCILWGGGLAGVVAAVLSFTVNQSIMWAVLHFFCSGFYIVYWLIVYLPIFMR